MSEEELVSLQELQYAVDNIGSFDLGDFNFDSLKIILNLIEKQSEKINRVIEILTDNDMKTIYGKTIVEPRDVEMILDILKR